RGSVAARELRHHWLNRLAARKDWERYLQHYPPHGATLTQRCWHLQALLATGRHDELLRGVEAIWPHPRSLPEACDPALEHWLDSGQAHPEPIWQRLHRAVADHQI